MNPINKIYPLKGKVQHYAWGGYDYIPSLLHVENELHKPFAEYWMGAHPGAPSVIVTENGEKPLDEFINANPAALLGEKVYREFGSLPYLFKVLDVRDMLSIQVHPTREAAAKGYAAEDAAGIPRNALNRNYKDRNHKPEVMVALSEFWLLHGFKNSAQLKPLLIEIPEFNFLLPAFEQGYLELYKTVMQLPQDRVDEILLPLIKRETAIEQISPAKPGYWVNKLFQQGAALHNVDRGIFSIYFFNIVHLQPGEAIFQAAGIPHAYLQGQNIELMANSDNVLRGGLTPKYIDVPELLKHIVFEGLEPHVLKAEKWETGELNYPCPVADFGISAVRLQHGESYQAVSYSAEIFIITEGRVQLQPGDIYAGTGESFVVLPGAGYKVTATANAVLFKAFVPIM